MTYKRYIGFGGMTTAENFICIIKYFVDLVIFCITFMQIWTKQASLCLSLDGTWNHGRKDIQETGNLGWIINEVLFILEVTVGIFL